MADHHFQVVNPQVLRRQAAASVATSSCGEREDAPVCVNGQTDVTCTGERYRGCPVGQTDCANQPGNDDDVCCQGWGPGTGDNIDHGACSRSDSGWGGINMCSYFIDSGPLYY
jgi:hypothetical protein